MDTKERKTSGARHLSGALFALPSPTWRPAPPVSGKNQIRKAAISFKGRPQNFLAWLSSAISTRTRTEFVQFCPKFLL
ncbi:hypothetical protein H8B02_09405 [Bradyrhizobium sp. Pear77]|uniref:hypothetical protein n=1 Tax=Bradyrhizobium altum TaxID=1571202 RepID=UPI001E4787D8|nr:hypothetical protein [Bradyrhizobium altum]MCC8953659.1 hypothetical protein [Bradyrhizobium altum]